MSMRAWPRSSTCSEVSLAFDGGNDVGMLALFHAAQATIKKTAAHGVALVSVTDAWMSGRGDEAQRSTRWYSMRSSHCVRGKDSAGAACLLSLWLPVHPMRDFVPVVIFGAQPSSLERKGGGVILNYESRFLAGILLIVLPTVMIDGVSILSLLTDDPTYMENPLRQDL